MHNIEEKSFSSNKMLSLMMALSERYPNAWHMLIERLILNNLIRSGVQVSKKPNCP